MIDFTNPSATAFWEGILGSATGVGLRRLQARLRRGSRARARSACASASARRRRDRAHRAHLPARLPRRLPTPRSTRRRVDGFLIGRASAYGGADARRRDLAGRSRQRLRAARRRRRTSAACRPRSSPRRRSPRAASRPSAPTPAASATGRRRARRCSAGPSTRRSASIMQLGGGGDSHNPWTVRRGRRDDLRAASRAQHMQLVPYLRGLARATRTPRARRRFARSRSRSPATRRASRARRHRIPARRRPPRRAGRRRRRDVAIVHFPPGDWIHWFDGHDPARARSTLDRRAARHAAGVRARRATRPALPRDIDTLVDATSAGRRDAREPRGRRRGARVGDARRRSRAGPKDCPSRTRRARRRWPLSWAPIAPVENVFVALDLRLAAFHGAAPDALEASGAALVELADEPAVRASTVSAFAVSPDGDDAVGPPRRARRRRAHAPVAERRTGQATSWRGGSPPTSLR